ncbi:MAG: hypothetical protein AABZ14_04710, partial [Candidatus Margulisiibacteriota bacterium]
ILYIKDKMWGRNFVLNFVPGRAQKNRRLSLIEYLPLQQNTGVYLLSIDGDEYLATVSNRTIQHFMPKTKKSFAGELKKQHATRRAD